MNQKLSHCIMDLRGKSLLQDGRREQAQYTAGLHPSGIGLYYRLHF